MQRALYPLKMHIRVCVRKAVGNTRVLRETPARLVFLCLDTVSRPRRSDQRPFYLSLSLSISPFDATVSSVVRTIDGCVYGSLSFSFLGESPITAVALEEKGLPLHRPRLQLSNISVPACMHLYIGTESFISCGKSYIQYPPTDRTRPPGNWRKFQVDLCDLQFFKYTPSIKKIQFFPLYLIMIVKQRRSRFIFLK